MTTPPALHHARLTAAKALLTATLPKLRGTFDVLHEHQPGYPTGGNGGSSKGDHSDRTGDTARRNIDKGPDRAARDLDDLDRICARIARDVTELASIIRRNPRRPNPEWSKALRTEAAATLNDTTNWCAAHLAVGSMEPTRRPDGRLCRWCEDLARELKMPEPPAELVDKRARGQRITNRDIADVLKARKAKRKKAKR
jgi:hypothetical protein